MWLNFCRTLSRLLWLIPLLPYLGACAATPSPTPPLATYLVQTEPLLAERRYSQAVSVLENAAQAYPTEPLPLLRIGQIYLVQQRWLLAEDAFNRALARQSATPTALTGLAETLYQQGRLTEALKFWQEAAKLDPQLPGVFTGLGRTRLPLFDFAGAEEAFLEQQRQKPDLEALWYLAALTAPQDWSKATEYLQAISTNSELADAPKSNSEQPTHDKVIAWRDYLQKTLETFSNQSPPAEVAKATGIALAQVQLWPLAANALTLAREGGKTDAETLAFLGYVLAQTGRPAPDIFKQARQADPHSALPFYFEGLSLRKEGQLPAAATLFNEAIKLDPENAAFYAELAETKAQQGNFGAAETLYLAAIEISKEDKAFQLLLARFYADRGYRLAEAGIPIAQEIIKNDEKNAEVHDLLGWMQFLSGAPDGGQAELRRALELAPDLISARYHLARWLETNGQTGQAALEYQRVIDWDKTGTFRDRALQNLQRLP